MKRKSALALLPTPPLRVDAQASSGVVPETEWVMITPDLACKWLDEANSNNRRLREDHVIRLANDMISGKWQGRNGEAIRFDTAGRLVDGQHRLYACVRSQTAFDSLVVRGVEPEAYSTIGIGARKSIGDFLGPMGGEKNTALLGATLRLAALWLDGNLDRLKDGRVLPTVSRMEECLAENPNIRESVNWVSGKAQVRKLFTASFACLIHFAGTRGGNQALVESFLERLGDGLGLMQDNPAYQLRKFLLSQRGTNPGNRRAGQQYVLALAIKAWTAYRNEEKIKALQFRANDKFPELV